MKFLYLSLLLSNSAFASPLLESPWPKFRSDMQQSGRSSVMPTPSSKSPWVFKTSKGIFASPVVGSQGEIYIGSADRNFYSLNAQGQLQWKVPTGEIIDSAGLLDKTGRISFGSGDGKLRSIDTASGQPLWEFAADQPSVTGGLINWFEGNVAVGIDGTLYAPNDNFRLYAINPESGAKTWHYPLNDQSWSSPAVDPETGNLFFGSNYIAPFQILQPFWKNIFALSKDGKLLWRQSVQASVAASPLLSKEGLVVVGAFNGTLYAYNKTSGKVVWTFDSQDHLYASAAEQADGTIIQASTDGHIYAIDGKNGSLKWSFASREPVRSSPAIDGAGNIYFGSGDGALYVLNPNGTLRFRMQLIHEDRNDLNASPALSQTSVILAGENGEIWSIPYDYCLRAARDERCSLQHQEPAEGVSLGFVTPFGSLKDDAPTTLAGAESITLAISGTYQGRPTTTIFDEANIHVSSATPVVTRVSGDGKSLIITPMATWGLGSNTVNVDIAYSFNGTKGNISKSISFSVAEKAAFPETEKLFVLRRLAVPVPTIMPSYNQIGFDSLSYVIRVLETKDGKGSAWVMAGVEDASGKVTVDPKSLANFALSWNSNAQGLYLESNNGFTANSMNLDIPFSSFRMSLQDWKEDTAEFGVLASTKCTGIPTYGYFLKNLGFCSPQEGLLTLSGAAEVRPLSLESEIGLDAHDVSWVSGRNWLNYATIGVEVPADATALYSLVLVNAETLQPIDVSYKNLKKESKAGKLRLSLPYASGPAQIKTYLLRNEAVVSEKLWSKDGSGIYR